MKKLLILLTLCNLTTCAFSRTLYVDANGTGANDGSSWTNAYNFLQDALADARSNTAINQIHVAQGIYTTDTNSAEPNGTGDREASFALINNVALYGGFPSGGSDPQYRDPNIYETILSGDIGLQDETKDNSYHVFYHPKDLSLDPSAILDGFTITAGNANHNSQPHYYGGGIYNHYCSPTVINCVFSGNKTDYVAGGMYNYYSNPNIINCLFSGNSAQSAGGMYNGKSSPNITGCNFSNNQADYHGSGIANGSDSNPNIFYCTFSYNSAGDTGGGIQNHNSDPNIFNCTFSYNSAGESGGGIYNAYHSYSNITKCTFSNNSAYVGGGMCNWISNPNITNCRFNKNSADYGGGMYNDGSYSNCIPTVNNCTFSLNTAIGYGSGMYNRSSNPNIKNCIIWDNTPDGNEIYNSDATSIPVISYCDVAGSGGSANWHPNFGIDAGGNIDIYPCFVDPCNSDFRLKSESLCINAGDPCYIAEPDETDLDGQPRIFLGRVDIGADEFVPSLEVPMHFTPRTLNPKSKGKWIKAHLILPAGFAVGDVNTNSPARLIEPFMADSNYMDVFINEDDLVEIEAAFDRAVFCSNGSMLEDIVVIARLTTGQYFYGTDTIRIKTNNLEYLAVLTSYWLEAGCGVPDWCEGSDINQDGTVDFIDFAFFDGCCLEFIKN